MRNPDENGDRGFFRCPVQDEDSIATIHICRKKIPVVLQDKSIDGFSVLVPRAQSRKLQMGPQWILESGGERTEVLAQWMFNAPDGSIQIGLRRLQDLTRQPQGAWFPTFRPYRKQAVNPEILMVGTVIVILLAISLPGIGDRLGTSGMIQKGLLDLCEIAKDITSGS